MKPNLQTHPYLFDVVGHKLYFKTGGNGGGISPRIVMGLMDELVSLPSIKDRFTDVAATILTRKGTIERLLQWPQIRRITVVLERENPTDFQDDKSFYDRLQRRGLKREEVTYVKAAGVRTISPDAEMKQIFAIAADNGKYIQHGINPAGELKTESSEAFPMQKVEKYNPDELTETEAFRRLVN